MRPIIRVFILSCFVTFFAGISGAQMTSEQKQFDFQQLAALYSKQYGLYEWKRDAIHFDALAIAPWLERVRKSGDDLDFYEICVEYVASLQDAHDAFQLPSGFSASLGLGIDIYDGKTIIDSINRSVLPAPRYPFQIGDEVVSVDGKPVEELIQAFLKYSIASNPRSARRSAAGRIAFRPQVIMPHAHEVGENAVVEIRRSYGDLEAYVMPWTKSGVPMLKVGPVPTPKAFSGRAAGVEDPPEALLPLLELQNDSVPLNTYTNILNLGGALPIFALPSDFILRLGRFSSDEFYSGTFKAGGKTI